MPAAGELTIFNRSHYEDVLVPPVKGWITPAQTAERYRTSTTSSACWRKPAPWC
jgi:polyphosphate kinase 2 (PPK2 family)